MRVLLDSNILLRWLEPDVPDQVEVAAAMDRLLQSNAVFCYTSQNLGEFWNTLTRPADRNGYGLIPEQANRRAIAIAVSIYSWTIWLFTGNGEGCLLIIESPEFRFTTPAWSQR